MNVSFLDSSGQWASVSGTSELATDRALVKEHYTPTLRAWLGDLGDGRHDGSENDPRLGMIRVKTLSATYSLLGKNIISRVVEVVQGAVTGKVAEINKLREITEQEVNMLRQGTAGA